MSERSRDISRCFLPRRAVTARQHFRGSPTSVGMTKRQAMRLPYNYGRTTSVSPYYSSAAIHSTTLKTAQRVPPTILETKRILASSFGNYFEAERGWFDLRALREFSAI